MSYWGGSLLKGKVLTGTILLIVLVSAYLLYPLTTKEQQYVDLVVQHLEMDRPYHLLKEAIASDELTRAQEKRAQMRMKHFERSAQRSAQMMLGSIGLLSEGRTKFALSRVGVIEYKQSNAYAVPENQLDEPLTRKEAESLAIETMQNLLKSGSTVTLQASVTAHQNDTFVRGLSGYSGDERIKHFVFLKGEFEIKEVGKTYQYALLMIDPITGTINSRSTSPKPYVDKFSMLHDIKIDEQSMDVYQ